MEKTEYTDKLAAAKDKVTKTMKQSIAELKEFIKKRDEFYSKDVKDMEFLSKVEEEERRLKGGGRVAM